MELIIKIDVDSEEITKDLFDKLKDAVMIQIKSHYSKADIIERIIREQVSRSVALQIKTLFDIDNMGNFDSVGAKNGVRDAVKEHISQMDNDEFKNMIVKALLAQ